YPVGGTPQPLSLWTESRLCPVWPEPGLRSFRAESRLSAGPALSLPRFTAAVPLRAVHRRPARSKGLPAVSPGPAPSTPRQGHPAAERSQPSGGLPQPTAAPSLGPLRPRHLADRGGTGHAWTASASRAALVGPRPGQPLPGPSPCPAEKEGRLLRLRVHHPHPHRDRKSTRLNSSHVKISNAVFCLKKK